MCVVIFFERLLIPDTIVVERDPHDASRTVAWWYYTDAEVREWGCTEGGRRALSFISRHWSTVTF